MVASLEVQSVIFGVFYRIIAIYGAVVVFFAALKVWQASLRAFEHDGDSSSRIVAFFHPYCSSGGGGERVLWVSLHALGGLLNDLNVRLVVYTGDDSLSKEAILERVRVRFQVILPDDVVRRLDFVTISSRILLEGSRYPVLTMLGQSLGSMLVGLECLLRCVPDVYIDTTGAPFTYPLARLGARCLVGAYVHYPIISADMLKRVVELRPSYNNSGRISGSRTMSWVKVVYYRIFALLYRFTGMCVDVTAVNSSWTKGHIVDVWGKRPTDVQLIFPPCGDLSPSTSSSSSSSRQRLVLTLGQFRPEKDHRLQIEAFAKLVQRDDKAYGDVRMIIMGATRGAEDEALVQELRALAEERGVASRVGFFLNRPFSELQMWMSRATVGMHTMWNEHFGISVVEMMAAGLIVVAHNSGGPKMDILKSPNDRKGCFGFLAESPDEYADAMEMALTLGDSKRERMVESARSSVLRFSDAEFKDKFLAQFVARLLST